MLFLFTILKNPKMGILLRVGPPWGEALFRCFFEISKIRKARTSVKLLSLHKNVLLVFVREKLLFLLGFLNKNIKKP